MENLNQYALFYLGSELYAVATSNVVKIDSVKKNKIRYIPNTYPYVKGIMTLEDDIVPLISLPERFNINSGVSIEDSYVIVCNLKEKGLSGGFIVDSVLDVIEFPENYELTTVNEVITGDATKFISGIFRLQTAENNQEEDEDENLLIILDIEKLLSSDGALEELMDDFK